MLEKMEEILWKGTTDQMNFHNLVLKNIFIIDIDKLHSLIALGNGLQY